MTGAIPLNSCNSSSMIFGEIICDNSRILVADLVLVNLNSFETDDFAAFFVIGLLFIDNYIFKDPYLCSDLKKHVNFIFEKTVTLSLLVVGFILHV